jgi:hypothetical protein
LADLIGLHHLDVVLDCTSFPKKSASPIDDSFAECRGDDLALSALKEGDPELLLETLDASAKRRLAKVYGICGAGEISLFGKRQHVPKLT